MTYQAILFDLDGTLLCIDTDDFTKKYVGMLVKYLAPYGYDQERFIPAMWQGVKSMVMNDGSKINHDVFYDVLSQVYGNKVFDDMDIILNFYKNEFNEAKAFTTKNPYSKQIIALAKSKAEHVILATNPFFPKETIETKLKWLGLSFDDFDYITHYENSTFCKPNPKYYEEICRKFNLDPKQCLMIGNDVQEDIFASIGFDHFLITNYLINREPTLPDCPHGDYQAFIDFLTQQ